MSQDLNEENLVSVIDDDGTEHLFEEIGRIETEKGKYIALIAVIDEDEVVDDDEEGVEFVILRVENEGDNSATLVPIEDEKEFDEVAEIFEEMFIEEDDGEE